MFQTVLLSQTSALILVAHFFAAPPDYSSVVTEEEAEQRNNSPTLLPAEDLSGLERPLMAFVQEYRFRPPPVYSEVSHQELRKTPTYTYGLISLIGTWKSVQRRNTPLKKLLRSQLSWII